MTVNNIFVRGSLRVRGILLICAVLLAKKPVRTFTSFVPAAVQTVSFHGLFNEMVFKYTYKVNLYGKIIFY